MILFIIIGLGPFETWKTRFQERWQERKSSLPALLTAGKTACLVFISGYPDPFY